MSLSAAPDPSNPSDLDVRHPFTTAQALAAGITQSQLRGSDFRRLSKGKYVSVARRPSALLEAEAALLGHPGRAVASHTTAARAFDLPVPDDPEWHVGVMHPDDRRRRSGVRSHVISPRTRVISLKGVPVAAPMDVFVQLAGVLTLVDLVVVGDCLVRKDWATPAQLVDFCATSDEVHAVRALAAARFVRVGVDSPMETRLRMLLVLAGLPEPGVNYLLRDGHGVVVRRFDLYYPSVRVLVEYDGRQHAEDAQQYAHDIYRREELDDGDWRIVVVTSAGIYVRPEETLLRVRKVLRARGMRDLPPRFHGRWRRHFPGRTP